MRKYKILILICLIFILSFLFSGSILASEEKIDYKTLYQNYKEVKIEKKDKMFQIKSDDIILFTALEKMEYVYTTEDHINIRNIPTIGYNKNETLKKDSKLIRVADSYTGWSIVLIQNNYYFVWNEFLTTEIPSEYKTICQVEKKEEKLFKSKTFLGKFKLTFYCHCEKCNGKWAYGPLANGGYPKQGRTIAMNDIPLGTKLMINGKIYIVEDRGTPYGHIDVFRNSHSECYELGVQYADVYLIK